MKKVQRISLSVLAVLGMATAAPAAVFSNFEAPTYTAGQTFAGVDNWVIASGPDDGAQITPTTDINTLTFYPNVLEGSQSAFLRAQVYRTWNGLESLVGDGLTVSWLQEASELTRAEVYLSDDPAIGNTPMGIILDASGNITILAPDSGFVDTGVDYLADKTYRMTMTLDFDANTMTATAENITDGGPVVNLGSAFQNNVFEASLVAAGANGGLYLVERDGNPVIFDDFRVENSQVPEPATLGLLGLGMLLVTRRRRRERV